jgi:tetratricopeptide (TPR) repeat protein
VCDASCFLNAGEGAGDFTAGYFVGLGSESNTRAKVVRAHRIVAVNPSFRLERGRAHRIVVERDEAGVRAWVDGALVLEYWDLVPLGTEHARVGFYAHASFLELTGVRILTRGVPERTLKQRHADRLFAARDYASASRIYAELEEQAEAARERPRLRLKRAIALMQLHRDRAAGPAWEEAARILRELSAAGDASLRHPALRALVCLELAAGRPAEALRVVAENADPAQPGRRYELLRVVEERFEELCERGEPDAALALGDAVMGTMRDEALRTLGPSNLSNNLPLVWSEVLAAREEMADADRLVEELRRVAGGSLPLAGWHAERAVRRLMAAGAPGEAAARARRMLEEFDALGLRGGEAERMRIGYRGLLALAMARIDPEGAVRELESILAQPLESLNTLDAETLAQQVLIEAGRPEEALRRRPDTREALLAAGRYDRLAELDPAGGDARTHVMAHLARGERPEAWRVVAMMGSNAGEAAWRDYFVGRLEERPFRERLALWRSLPADDARFWRGLRHELHGRRAEALSCYRAVLDPPRVSRAHETYARGAVARLR